MTAKYLLWDGVIASVPFSTEKGGGGYREASYPHSRPDYVGNGQDEERGRKPGFHDIPWIETAQHFLKKFVYWLFPIYHCDTSYGEWRDYLNQRALSDEKTVTSLVKLQKYAVGDIFPDSAAG